MLLLSCDVSAKSSLTTMQQLILTVLNLRAKSASFLLLTRNFQKHPEMPAESCVLRFSKITEHASAPEKGSAKAAGFDLKRYDLLMHSCENINVPVAAPTTT